MVELFVGLIAKSTNAKVYLPNPLVIRHSSFLLLTIFDPRVACDLS